MEIKKINQEALNSIYKTAQIGLASISNVSKEVENSAMKEELDNEYEGYEKFISEITTYIVQNGYEKKEVNPMKKAFMWTSIKLNTLTDDSSNHVAQLMIKGTVMGITEMQELINSENKALSEEVLHYAEELKDIMEKYEQQLKNYL